ncbi:MAG: FecR domain-containing protein [Pseudomonadota bacterium]
MSDKDGSDPDHSRRIEEAAYIFERLDENPDDLQAQRDRDAFLARGEAEREAYNQVAKAVQAAKLALKPKPKGPPSVSILVFIIVSALLYVLYQPVSIYLLADEKTRFETRSIMLASGDIAILDASSAVIDNSAADIRHVTLLQGAVYFDVQEDSRPFVVAADDVSVEVLGTEFEVAMLDDQLLVGVSVGEVIVRIKERIWRLEAGDQFRWSDDGIPSLERGDIKTVGAWREDLILAEGMTFGEVIAMIDRRLPGPVIVVSADLANREAAGRFNLSSPIDALRAVAATTGGTVRSASPFVTIVSEQ